MLRLILNCCRVKYLQTTVHLESLISSNSSSNMPARRQRKMMGGCSTREMVWLITLVIRVRCSGTWVRHRVTQTHETTLRSLATRREQQLELLLQIWMHLATNQVLLVVISGHNSNYSLRSVRCKEERPTLRYTIILVWPRRSVGNTRWSTSVQVAGLRHKTLATMSLTASPMVPI